jgi:predicted MFS family arabinose efflux permease
MIACDGVRMVAAGTIVLALIVGRPAYLQVVAVAFVDGALFITSYICERGALRQVVPGKYVQDAVAQNEARTFAASIVGPPLGGVLFAAARALPFIADTASFLCSMTAISLTRSTFQAASGREASFGRGPRVELSDGIKWLWRQRFFRSASLLFAAGNPVFTGLYLLAVLLAKQHGASSAAVGAMFAIVGVGGLLGASLASPLRRALTARQMIVGEQWLLLAVVLALLIAHNALLIGLLIAAAEFVTPPTNSVVAGSRVAATPDHLQGRVQAAATLLTMSLAWLGPLAVGFAFEHAGPTATVLAVATWVLGLAILAALAPALRHGPPEPPMVWHPTRTPTPADTENT